MRRFVFLTLVLAGCSRTAPTPGEQETTAAVTASTTGQEESTTGTTGDEVDDEEADEWSTRGELDIFPQTEEGLEEGGRDTPCDVWDPDACGTGEKCVPAVCTPGSSTWDCLVCRPVEGDGMAGDECSGSLEGFDTCAAGHMCWELDPDTSLGVCVKQCTGSPSEPMCDEGFTCPLTSDGVLSICLPQCDPLAIECPDPEDTCIPQPNGDGFLCTNDFSGEGGEYGSECEFANVCDPGLQCISPDVVPNCMGTSGCCAPHCDLDAPQCPDEALGVVCQPWYEAGQAPEGYEHVGICALPFP